MKPETRFQFPAFLNSLGLFGEGAEIGCAFGGFARTMLIGWRCRKYWLIDPYRKQDQYVYMERQETQEKYDKWAEEVGDMCRYSDGRAEHIRKMSVDAAAMFKDEQLDFVFIDGNHSYDAVMSDLNAWYPKVHKGGIVAGHDYYDETVWPNFCQVKGAVTAWLQTRPEIELNTLSCSSFYFVHP